jgi:hypothetical protein
MNTLLRVTPPIVALWGWACLAMAVASQGFIAAFAVVGFAGSVFARTRPAGSAVVELFALAALGVAGAGTSRWTFVVVGAVLVVAARAITEAARRNQS